MTERKASLGDQRRVGGKLEEQSPPRTEQKERAGEENGAANPEKADEQEATAEHHLRGRRTNHPGTKIWEQKGTETT